MLFVKQNFTTCLAEFAIFTYLRKLYILIFHCHWKTLAQAQAKAINWGSWASWIFNIWQNVTIAVVVHIARISWIFNIDGKCHNYQNYGKSIGTNVLIVDIVRIFNGLFF